MLGMKSRLIGLSFDEIIVFAIGVQGHNENLIVVRVDVDYSW